MSDQKCGLLILDAIDQLRKRKARPDLDRICHMLERRHGFKGTTVNDELQRLVNEGTVVKVDYKGNTSYRNAAKWVKTKTQFYGSFYNSNDISSVVLEAVRALTMAGKDHPLRSASIIDIEQYLLKRDSQSNLNLATLRAVLEKEVDKQNLHQLPNGEFIPLKPNFSDSSTPEKGGSDTTKKPDSTPPKCELRVENQSLQILATGGGGRSKEESKLDSDNICQENSSNSSEESQPSRCDYCLFTASANRKGEAEELLTCKDCGAKAHPSCMEYTKLLYEKYPDSLNWQCPDCKTCIVCEENNSTTDLLTCYTCFNAFHMNCHDPSITTKPTGIWLCSLCDTAVDKDKMAKSKTNGSDGKSEHEAYSFMDPFHKTLEEYPTTVPIARKWSIENVEEFFKFIGFEDEAPAFREQEIDGLSLLLMKRNDVLTGLGIKLGPALKIYKHIIALQARIGDN